MSTCNRLDLQTLRSQPVMPKNLLDHFWGLVEGRPLTHNKKFNSCWYKYLNIRDRDARPMTMSHLGSVMSTVLVFPFSLHLSTLIIGPLFVEKYIKPLWV